MPENLEIRQASLLDQLSILALLDEMHQEGGGIIDEPDWFKISHTITSQTQQGLVFVAELNEKVVGSIGLAMSAEWYSSEPVAGDLWYFVSKKGRKSTAGYKLLKHVKEQCAENDIKLKVGHVLGYSVDRMDRFYEKLRFERVGTMNRMM